MVLECPADFQRTFDRRFRAVVKNQRHPVPCWNLDQSTRCFGTAEFVRVSNNLIERIEQRALLVYQQLGVANDIDEKNVADFQPDLFCYLGSHLFPRTLRKFLFYIKPRGRSGEAKDLIR